ncbi:peptidoglycan-binding protein [Actinomadura sp. 1N219]|uniref:peptidoglycan-binding protein n=1 Tax=Actinomadura sp. 1N219 TaxID=3375152 RepID=UPI0037AB24FB
MADDRGTRSTLARRQRLLVVGACAVAVISTAGLGASTLVTSPAEDAVRTSPPDASVLTAPVESKELRRTVVFRGRFTAARSLTFTASAGVGPDGRAVASGAQQVVSKVPHRTGDTVRAGAVLAEVSYRPVFVLPGRIPAVRDLAQGQNGGDVTQLQVALAALGYGRGSDREGAFGAGTAAAVRRFYRAIGYAAPVAASGPQKPDGGEPGDMEGSDPGGGGGTRVMVPRSEVMFSPSFPARISRMEARLGEPPGEPMLTLSVGGLKLIGELDPTLGDSVRADQRVRVLAEESGREYAASVAEIGKIVTPKTEDGGRPYIPVRIAPERAWNPSLNGADVQITVTTAVTGGTVLAVPQAAVTAQADGMTSVTVLPPSGGRSRVRVTAGMSADGFVQVTPVGDVLRPGDRVVVGR